MFLSNINLVEKPVDFMGIKKCDSLAEVPSKV